MQIENKNDQIDAGNQKFFYSTRSFIYFLNLILSLPDLSLDLVKNVRRRAYICEFVNI